MKLAINSTAICRCPAFSVNQTLENAWPDLKIFIKKSSPAFYSVIQEITYQNI